MTPFVVIRDVRVQRADVYLRFLAVPAIPFAVEMEETLSVGLTFFFLSAASQLRPKRSTDVDNVSAVLILD